MEHTFLNQKSEEELIELAQQGHELSQLQLLENYKKLILSVIPPYFRLNEEFLQEAKVSALEAIATYEGKKPSFGEYIQKTVRKNVKIAATYANQSKFASKSLDKPLFHDQKLTLGDIISKEDGSEIIRSIIEKEEKLLISEAIKDEKFSSQDQAILQQLVDGKEIEEIGIINITVSLLKKLGLYKYTRTEKNLKREVINKLLPEEKRLSLLEMPNIPRWRQFKQPTRRAFDAIEEAVQKDIYMVRTSSFTKYIWMRTMVENLFGGSTLRANKEFFIYRLQLTGEEQEKIQLLTEITNNNSTIFSNKYSTVRDKLRGHTLALDEIIRKTKLTPQEKEILNNRLEGEIIKREYKNEKQIDTILSRVRYKLLVSAIQLHPYKFENGANKEQLKKEIEQTEQKRIVFDRYLRFRLQILFEKYAQQKNISVEELPYTLTRGEFARNNILSDYFLKVFGRLYPLLTFTFPEKFERWQFDSKNKWKGEQGRNLFFEAMNSILSKEKKFTFTVEDSRKYHLSGTCMDVLKINNFGLVNKLFTEEFLKKKVEKNYFENYWLNRKFLGILFDTKHTKEKLEKLPDDKTIATMKREELYATAQLREANQLAWESMISAWGYSAKIIKFSKASKLTKTYPQTVKYHYRKTRDTLEKVVSNYLKNFVSNENL